jgi:hypothetical protein
MLSQPLIYASRGISGHMLLTSMRPDPCVDGSGLEIELLYKFDRILNKRLLDAVLPKVVEML